MVGPHAELLAMASELGEEFPELPILVVVGALGAAQDGFRASSGRPDVDTVRGRARVLLAMEQGRSASPVDLGDRTTELVPTDVACAICAAAMLEAPAEVPPADPGAPGGRVLVCSMCEYHVIDLSTVRHASAANVS